MVSKYSSTYPKKYLCLLFFMFFPQYFTQQESNKYLQSNWMILFLTDLNY